MVSPARAASSKARVEQKRCRPWPPHRSARTAQGDACARRCPRKAMPAGPALQPPHRCYSRSSPPLNHGAPPMLDIAFARSALPKSGALVLLADGGGRSRTRSGGGRRGHRRRRLARAGSGGVQGQAGKTCTILAPGARAVPGRRGRHRQARRTEPRNAEEAGGAAAAALAREPAAAVGRGRPVRRRWPPPSPPAPRCAAIASTATAPPRSPRTGRNSPGSPCWPPIPPGARDAWTPLNGRGRGRAPRPRPGQRAAQRADPGRNGRALPQPGNARPQGRGAGPARDGQTRLRRAARASPRAAPTSRAWW